MVKRILLRAYKDPFTVASPRRVYRDDLIGDNVGNLLSSNATYKLLHTTDATVTTDALRAAAGRAGRVDASYDHLVLPLANAFRLTYADALDRLSDLVERLDMPVTVLGVGAQLDLRGSSARLEPMRASVQRFVSAVLDRGPSIGVSGESTQRYLRHLGFRDVEIVGSPAMFFAGPSGDVEKSGRRLTRSSRISLNLSPAVEGLDGLVEAHTQRYPRMHYTAQHRDALGMLLERGTNGTTHAGARTPLPVTLTHPLVAEGRSSAFTDPLPWLAHLSACDFSFGTRIDGAIAALLTGTPAYLLAADAPALELARHYDIPHRTMYRVTDRTDAAALYEEADYSAFNRGLPDHFDRFAAFLNSHHLHHVYEAGEDPHRFDRRASTTPYPGAVTEAPRSTATRVLQRLTRPVTHKPRSVDSRPAVRKAYPVASITDTTQPVESSRSSAA